MRIINQIAAAIILVASTSVANADEVQKVTAEKLYAVYWANEAEGDWNYGDQQLVVTGTVGQVEHDMEGKPVVYLNHHIMPD
jgi:hypothetical protein